MVKSGFQRKGVGAALLEYAVKEFNLDEYSVWLSTQTRGHGLYVKYGWKDVDGLEVDLGKHGVGEGMHWSPCMIRDPKSSSITR